MTDSKEALDLSEIVELLRPSLPGLIETIALAGSASDDPAEKGKRVPGDVRAAAIGLELVSKYLAGSGSDRATQLLEGLRKARESSLSGGTANGVGPN